MRAFVVDTQSRVAPFDEAPGLAMVQFSTLRTAVDGALGEAGAQPLTTLPTDMRDDEELLVISDRLFVARKLVRDFLREARGYAPVQLNLRRTPSVDYLAPVQGARLAPLDAGDREEARGGMAQFERQAVERAAYDLFLIHGRDLPRDVAGDALLQALRDHCRPLVVSKRELCLPVRLPVLGDGAHQTMAFPITSSLAVEVRHWVHILWLNQLCFGMRFMDLLRDHKLWAAGRLLAAFPWSRARLFGKFVRVGRNCRIHPTAHLELCELGDNVVVGARASIRNSFVGDGAHIGEHSVLLSSTVGQGAFVTPKTFLVWSVLYPGATVGNYKLQVSLVGRDAHVNTWAGLIDAKFQGSIMVELDGQLHSTARQFLGSCVGHGAMLGAKVLIQPGRAIPNGAVVVMRPDEVISEVPKGLPPGVPLVRHEGKLVPLASLKGPP